MSLSFQLSDSDIQRLLTAFTQVGQGVAEIQSILAGAASTRPQIPPPQPKAPQQNLGGLGTPPSPPSITGVKWLLKGGAPAQPSDGWAYCFSANRDGSIPTEVVPLVSYLQKNGAFKLGAYEVSLSKDGKFLNRKRI